MIKDSSSVGFSQRKKDHIEISLRDESQASLDQFSKIQLQHNAIPEINFADVDLKTQVFGHSLQSPLFISSMTLGHDGAKELNETLMGVSESMGWMMGVGSQRRQLFDPQAFKECESLRARYSKAVVFSNIGLSQIIDSPVADIQALVDSLGAKFLVVHCNPLQEAIQPEGTPQFRGGLKALTTLCEKINVPVVLKETGCGLSEQTFDALKNCGLAAVDVSGLGGTHWGRVEGLRMQSDELGYQVAQTFANWGISTVDSVENGIRSSFDGSLWASGGVRNGLQAAKLLALGAERVGFAQPILVAALQGEGELQKKMLQLDHELKVAMFCLGIADVESLVGKRNLLRWK